MARPRVADKGDGLQIWGVAANMLNKQSRTADSGWSSSLGVGWGANNPPPYNSIFVTNHCAQPRNRTDYLAHPGSEQGPVAGCCECGDEPSGSCATELVS
jgi:hypothetical protein